MRALALAAALAATPAAAAPALVADPAAPGPDAAPAGRALLEQVFPDGLPFPFEDVLDALRARVGPENVQTALVPLGRSLQRQGAAPGYFASPRVVVAVTGDRAAGPGDLRLADRLYLGYQPAADIVEALSYNPAAGRFEFQEVVGYAGGGAIAPAERRVCLACHQGAGPIFARPLWSETNANPAVAALLAPLGPGFHGAPVRTSVDALDAFDAATDRAARIPLANRLWAEGCADARCRAALLAAAVRVGLGAAAPDPPPGFVAATRWPEGLAGISPDLPNRDPVPLLAEMDPAEIVETTGVLNPETPRAPLVLWTPAGGFAAAAREIAAQLSPGDLLWIDRLAAPRAARPALALACDRAEVGSETRFACEGPEARVSGFIAGDSGRLELGGSRPSRVAVWARRAGAATELAPAGLAPRLANGRRVAVAALEGGALHLALVDDLGPLAAGLAAAADDPALGPGPFDRQAALRLIARILEAPDG